MRKLKMKKYQNGYIAVMKQYPLNSWKRRYNKYNGMIFLPDGLMRQMLGKQLMNYAKPGNLELPGDV